MSEDRREHQRLNVECPVKVYDPWTRRYRSGITRNLSSSGALIELQIGTPSDVGEMLGVAIDTTGSAGLLSIDDLKPAVVARRLDTDPHQIARTIAVRFATSQPAIATAQATSAA